MPDPVEDWESVDELDGIDVRRGEGCPHCGAPKGELDENPAGYYGCTGCGAVWAGHKENASLAHEPHRGPAVDGEPTNVSGETPQEAFETALTQVLAPILRDAIARGREPPPSDVIRANVERELEARGFKIVREDDDD